MKHFYDQIDSKMFSFAGLYKEAVERCLLEGTLVEVGCWVGQSLAYLLVEAWNSNKEIRVVGVDAFSGNIHSADVKEFSQWELFRKNLAPVWKEVRVIKTLSHLGAEYFEDGSVDMAFIDADHHQLAVARDLEAWWPKVKAGGWLAGHDVKHPPVAAALREFADLHMVTYTKRSEENSWVIEKPYDHL